MVLTAYYFLPLRLLLGLEVALRGVSWDPILGRRQLGPQGSPLPGPAWEGGRAGTCSSLVPLTAWLMSPAHSPHQVQELIINKDPTLLDNFLDVSGWEGPGWGWGRMVLQIPSQHSFPCCRQEIIAFQADKSIEVRKFVIGFIEEAWYGLATECPEAPD